MTIIEMTRQLGKMIQQDDRYIAYYLAQKTNDNDKDLQNLIGEFNLKRIALNEELSKNDKDTNRIKDYDCEIKGIYSKIMSNSNMARYNIVKAEYEKLYSEITQILNMCANGEDPETCEPTTSSGCSGACSSCAGCG